MHEEDIIKQFKDEMERLKRENELLKDQIAKLEARLAKYEWALERELKVLIAIDAERFLHPSRQFK